MKNVLVPIDFSDQTDAVVAVANEMARALGAHLWLLHVAPPDPDFVGYGPGPSTVRDQVAKELHEEHRQIQAIAEGLREQGLEVTALAIQGATVECIVGEIEKLEIDLVVLGSHGRGAVFRMLLGSVSEGVLRRAGCPVLIVPAKDRDS
jgi:nucleotide-binding universal stress UspA family protein